jgi:hypothetical protein
VQYAHAAYAVLGAYALAIVVWLARRAFNALWSGLISAAGVAMLAAVMLLGSPVGADDMEQEENWTPVTVTVVDEAGQPIEGAKVYLDLIYFWQSDPDLEEDRAWWSDDTTHQDGVARIAIRADVRFKRLLIRVRREPLTGGYNEPTTIGDCVGYEDARLETNALRPKAENQYQVAMSLRSHPESALLALELAEPPAAEAIVSRSVRLVLSAEDEPPASEYTSTFDEGAVAGNAVVRDLYVSGTERLVLQLGPDLAGRPLRLQVLERDWSVNEEAYLEQGRRHIDAVPLGNESTPPTITLPGRATSNASQ